MEFPELFSHNPGPFWFYKVLRTFRRERILCHHCLKRKCEQASAAGLCGARPAAVAGPSPVCRRRFLRSDRVKRIFPKKASELVSVPAAVQRVFTNSRPGGSLLQSRPLAPVLSPRHHGLLLKAVNPPKGTFSRTALVSRLFCAESLSRPLQTFVLPRPPRGCFWTGWASGAQDLSPRVRWELVFNKVILLPGTSLPSPPQARAPPPVSCPLPSAVSCLLWRTDGGPLAGHVPAGTALCSASLLSARAGRGGRGAS